MIVSEINLDLVRITDFSSDNINENQVAVRWLGQAGFEFIYNGCHLMIDPYLSDSLAKKYAGKEFPHNRMITSPFSPDQVNGLDYILCTHRHSDHMDPETVPVLLENNSKCKLIAPKAEKDSIEKLGITDVERLIFVNVNESIELSDDISVDVLPSAHEAFKIDSDGNHHYLGYKIHLGEITIYHSGDCIPFPELSSYLNNVDVAFLPVNGRNEFRNSRGVPGNFTFEESVSLCRDAGVRKMVCHHFGMFDFNTVDEKWLRESAYKVSSSNFSCFVPDMQHYMILKK